MRILHILDHSIPLHSGYTFRTMSILNEQRRMGWDTYHLTSTKQGQTDTLLEHVGDLSFYRTQATRGRLSRMPVMNQLEVVWQLEKRLAEVVKEVKPMLLHAHSPSLNGMAALRVARRFERPVVYEVRAFWEDAAVDHGTSREGGLRYRLTRALETRVLKQSSAVTTICEGLRNDIVARGIPEERVTVIPNAVDIDRFTVNDTPDNALRTRLGLENRTILGFIGSFYAYEGLELLLYAMKEILQSEPDVHLLFVGGGPEEQRLKKLTRGRMKSRL